MPVARPVLREACRVKVYGAIASRGQERRPAARFSANRHLQGQPKKCSSRKMIWLRFPISLGMTVILAKKEDAASARRKREGRTAIFSREGKRIVTYNRRAFCSGDFVKWRSRTIEYACTRASFRPSGTENKEVPCSSRMRRRSGRRCEQGQCGVYRAREDKV